jgi:hypothetical protein
MKTIPVSRVPRAGVIIFFISHREAAANLAPSIGARLLGAANSITTSNHVTASGVCGGVRPSG